MKNNLEATWGVRVLPCVLEIGETTDKLDINGGAGFKAKSAEDLFRGLQADSTRKILISHFKEKWIPLRGSLVKKTFIEGAVTHKEVPQVIAFLKDEINDLSLERYGISATNISIRDAKWQEV